MNKLKKYFLVVGLLLGTFYTGLMYYTFLVAYFNNGIAIVDINYYGEANFEFVLVPILILINLYATHYFIKNKLDSD